MRLLHTSDWHIGRSLHGTDLLAEQEQVLGGLADVVAAETVDVVLVAGDVYDRAVPSADATAVLSRVVARLRRAGAAVVLTPGNHDSARRLGTFSELLAAGGLHVRAETPRLDEPVLLADEHGDVAIYGLPYLEPEVARFELGLPEARSHEAVLAEAMDRVRADLFLRPGTRSVVLAHAFVGGGQPSESERDISVGGVDLVPGRGVRRRRLRGAGPPAPAADPHPAAALQRLAAGLLVRRGRAAEAGLAGRASTPPGWPTSVRCRCRPRARWRCSPAPSTSCSPTRRTSAPSSTSSPPGSPIPSGRPTRCAGCRRGSRTASTWSGPARPRPATARSYQELLRGRSDMEVAGEFVSPRPRRARRRRRSASCSAGRSRRRPRLPRPAR